MPGNRPVIHRDGVARFGCAGERAMGMEHTDYGEYRVFISDPASESAFRRHLKLPVELRRDQSVYPRLKLQPVSRQV